MGCPTDEAFAELVEGTLPLPTQAALHGHVDVCLSCRQVLAALARGASHAEVGTGAIIGRYRLEERLGRGGMGVVFSAVDSELRRSVALKFLSPWLSEDERATVRLLREARAASALDHPHLAQIHGLERVDGHVFLSMPLYQGETLAKRVSRGAMPAREVAEIMLRVASGLSAAHEAGIIHRDVKPSNIMLLDSGGVRLIDFGLAKLADDSGASLTHSGQLLGTVAYLAPEQHTGGELDLRGDLWALGVTAYEMLAGQRPFVGNTHVEVLQAARSMDPPPLEGVDRDLETIVLTCLEKDPARRYPSAAALEGDLQRYLDAEPVVMRRAGKVARTWRRALQRPLSIAGVLTLAALMFAAGVQMWLANRRAQARIARAQQLGEQLQLMSSEMRAAYLMPLHDVAPLRSRLREDIVRLLGRGELDGLGEYAAGAGYVALRDYRQARPYLDAAWRDGQRGPEMAYALALTYSELYHTAVLDVEVDLHPERKKELDEQYAVPARRYLHAALDAHYAEPEVVQAALAQLEGRDDEAMRDVETALGRAPSHYEVVESAVWVLYDRAYQQQTMRDLDGSFAARRQAVEMLRRAQGIARSDPRLYFLEEKLSSQQYTLMTKHGRPEAAEWAERASAAAQHAIEADSSLAESYLAKAHALNDLGAMQLESGDNKKAVATLRESEALARQTLKLDPDSAAAEAQLGQSLNWQANLAEGDERIQPLLTEAIASLEKSKSWGESNRYRADAYALQARLWARHGENPEPAWERSIALSRELTGRLRDADNVLNLACTLGERADWKIEHGLNPTADLDASEAELETSRKLDPGEPLYELNLALNLSARSRYRILAGEDPAPTLEKSIQLLQHALGAKHVQPSEYDDLSAAYLLSAWNEHSHARDPAPSVGHARQSADRALALEPESEKAVIARATVELLAARIALLHGASPRVELARALQLKARLPATGKPDFAALMFTAEIARWRAANGALDGCAEGRQALDAALKITSASARAWWLRAGLLHDCAALDSAGKAALSSEAQSDSARALTLDRFVERDLQ